MFKNLSYKKKNQLLLLMAVLLFFMIYVFAVKKTMAAYTVYVDASNQIELAANVPAMTVQLEKELIKIDAKIGDRHKAGASSEQALLELLTNYCQREDVVLREFPQATLSTQGNLLVETNVFVVEGSFSALLHLVYILEQKTKLGKVASVHYQLKKDTRTKKMVLTAGIYIQNIKKQ